MPGVHKVATREIAVARFATWLAEDPQRSRSAQRDLAGRDLCCWCPPDLCHGDVLLRVAAGEDPVAVATHYAALARPLSELPFGPPRSSVPPRPYNPVRDGVDHINAYSAGRTPLGRWLSNFAFAPMELNPHGYFASMEGYWYWLSCEPGSAETLRKLHGPEAKRVGRQLRGQDWPVLPHFQTWVLRAINAKVTQSPGWADALRRSTLPIVHYYAKGPHVVAVEQGLWIWEHYEALRAALQGET